MHWACRYVLSKSSGLMFINSSGRRCQTLRTPWEQQLNWLWELQVCGWGVLADVRLLPSWPGFRVRPVHGGMLSEHYWRTPRPLPNQTFLLESVVRAKACAMAWNGERSPESGARFPKMSTHSRRIDLSAHRPKPS